MATDAVVQLRRPQLVADGIRTQAIAAGAARLEPDMHG
jgi:hypothetical protein